MKQKLILQILFLVANVMQIVKKSCSRMNFAARLSVRLFDEETRLTHNVSGRGKPISLIQRESLLLGKSVLRCSNVMLLRTLLLNGGNSVTAIDERSRRLKNKPSQKKPPLTMSTQQ